MATYSSSCRVLPDRLCKAHKRAEDPPARRTRSQTEVQTASTSTGLKPKARKITKRSKRSQVPASKLLCTLRLQLKKRLENENRFPTHQRLRQLPCVPSTGALGQLPDPVPTKLKALECLKFSRRRRLAGPGPLSNVESLLTDGKIEGEWGLLPGEVHKDVKPCL